MTITTIFRFHSADHTKRVMSLMCCLLAFICLTHFGDTTKTRKRFNSISDVNEAIQNTCTFARYATLSSSKRTVNPIHQWKKITYLSVFFILVYFCNKCPSDETIHRGPPCDHLHTPKEYRNTIRIM